MLIKKRFRDFAFPMTSIRLVMSVSLLVSEAIATAARAQFFLSRRKSIGVAAGEDDLRPFLLEKFRSGEPDTGRATCD